MIWACTPLAAVVFLLVRRIQKRTAMRRRLGRTQGSGHMSFDGLARSARYIAPLVGAAGAFAIGVFPGLVLAGVVFALPALVAGVRERRLAGIRQAAMPELVEQIGRSVGTGTPIQLALLQMAETCPRALQSRVLPIAEASKLGIPLDTALLDWVERDSTPGVSALVATLRLGIHSGGVHPSSLEALAASLRDTLELHEEIESEIAQAKASVILMVALPIVMGVASAVGGGSTGHFLFRTSIGSLVLACGLALDALGAFWMYALVKRVRS